MQSPSPGTAAINNSVITGPAKKYRYETTADAQIAKQKRRQNRPQPQRIALCQRSELPEDQALNRQKTLTTRPSPMWKSHIVRITPIAENVFSCIAVTTGCTSGGRLAKDTSNRMQHTHG